MARPKPRKEPSTSRRYRIFSPSLMFPYCDIYIAICDITQEVDVASFQLLTAEIARSKDRACYNPASILDRGSRTSRSASPMKLKERTASITARAGKITRCGASNKCERPSLSMAPQLAVGG